MVKEEAKGRRPSKEYGHPKERRMSIMSQTGREFSVIVGCIQFINF
jgi:hypothetical protein